MATRPDYIAPQDLKFANVNPDPGFDPEHNRAVIEKTIKENEKLVRARNRDAEEGNKERINALSTYLRSISTGGKSTDREKFFGKKYLAYLRGSEVMQRIKGELELQGRNGQAFRIVPSENAKREVRKLTMRGGE